jgi:outer membrane autotransporter protein
VIVVASELARSSDVVMYTKNRLFRVINSAFFSHFFKAGSLLLLSISVQPVYAKDYDSTFTGSLLDVGDTITTDSEPGWDVSNVEIAKGSGNNNITTTGNLAYGLSLSAINGKHEVTALGLTINTSGNSSNGIDIHAPANLPLLISLTDSKIITKGSSSYGIKMNPKMTSSGLLKLINTDINVSGKNSGALIIENIGSNKLIAEVTGGSFISSGTMDMSTYEPATVSVTRNSKLTMKDANIINKGTGGGVRVLGNATLTLLGSTTIETHGDDYTGDNAVASGIFLTLPEALLQVDSETVSITTHGKNTPGIEIYELVTQGGGVVMKGAKITTYGENSNGLKVKGGNNSLTGTKITTHGNNSAGIIATNGGGKINGNAVEISTTGNNSSAVVMEQPGNISLSKNSVLSTTGTQSHGISLQKGKSYQFSDTDLPDNISVTGIGSSILQVTEGSHLTLKNIKFSPKSNNSWGLLAEDGGLVRLEHDVNFNGNSLWVKGYSDLNVSVIELSESPYDISQSLIRVDKFGLFDISNQLVASTVEIAALESSIGDEGGQVTLGKHLSIKGTEKTTYAGSIIGNGDLIQNGRGSLTLSGNKAFNFNGDIHINSGILATAGTTQALDKNFYFDNNGKLDISKSTNTFTLGRINSKSDGGGIIELGNKVLTINGDNTGDSAFSGEIKGSGTLVKNGSETLTLSGKKVFNYGSTVVNDGTLKVGLNANASGNDFNLNNTGILDIADTKGFTLGMISGNGNINLGSQNLTVDSTNNGIYSGSINGTGSLIKNNSGTLTLLGEKSLAFTGDIYINSGTLGVEGVNNQQNRTFYFDNAGKLDISKSTDTFTLGSINSQFNGGGVIQLGNTTLAINGDNTGGSNFSGKIEGSGSLIKNGSSTLTLLGNDVFGYTGSTTINNGKLKVGLNANASGKDFNINKDGTLDIVDTKGFTLGMIFGNGNINLGSQNLTVDGTKDGIYSGNISGTGSLIKTNAGTLTLSNNNAFGYTGSTTVNGGTLKVGLNVNASGKDFNINQVGSLDIADTKGFTLGMISGNGNIHLGSQNITVDGTNSGVYSGAINGSGSLIKSNTGTLKLSGEKAFAYSGDTIINGGVLVLSNLNPDTFKKKFTLAGGWLDLSESGITPDEKTANNWKGITLTNGNSGKAIQGGVIGSNDNLNYDVPSGSAQIVDYVIGSPTDQKGKGIFIVKTGSGILELAGNNHYVGNTRIEDGILKISADNNLGDTTAAKEVVLNGGELNISKSFNSNRLLELRKNGTVTVDDKKIDTVWHGVNGSNQILTKKGEGRLAFKDTSALAGIVVDKGTLDMEKATISSGNAPAIAVHEGIFSLNNGKINSNSDVIVADGNSTVNLSNTTIAKSGGALYRLTNGANGILNASKQILSGDIIADGANSYLRFNLANGSSYSGNLKRTNGGAIDIHLKDAGSTWHLNENTGINNLTNGGMIDFSAPEDNKYKSLEINGHYSGGGKIQLNTELNVGGALTNQHTDRLLIDGNVSGQTQIVLKTSGSGGNTNTSLNNQKVPSEGISLVQVAGSSSPDAFSLVDGYVVASESPYQYRLFTYGPDKLDQDQNLLNHKLFWDYRLETAYLNADGQPVPGIHKKPSHKIAIVPQASSYLVTGLALQNYHSMVMDSLNNRLGEVRRNKLNDVYDGHSEVFARTIFNNGTYRSNLNWYEHGYDFDQRLNALQIGGNWIHLSDSNNDLRLGLAGTIGTSKVQPKTTHIENSKLSLDARGIALTASWQGNNGWYADGIVSFDKYDGTISTAKDNDAGKINAKSMSFSLEGGKSIQFTNGVKIQPQSQLIGQKIHYKNHKDSDGIGVKMDTMSYLTSRTGVRLSYPIPGTTTWEPYARISYQHTWNNNPTVKLSKESFNAGQVGSAMQFAVGANGQITPQLTVYGELSKQQRLDNYGFNNLNGNFGVRYMF